jgi:tetratricopeptide (TPR) repeat protein
MSSVAKLRKRAVELEERRQYDKALAAYEQVLQHMELSDEEMDVGLFNRVGDLTLRQGKVTEAVSYYEKAVDLYTEGGFLNNAIALCNKILRNAPGRTSIYYKLGRISARKGFTSDAKANFLEYADRMQRAGQWQEAFSALEEFADLCPDQDDVRLMLAEQLTRQNRGDDALKQLQILYAKYVAEDRTTEANATLERMRALDPHFVPSVHQQAAPEKGSDLIFLDVGYAGPTPGEAPRGKEGGPGIRTPSTSGDAPHLRAMDPRLSGEVRTIGVGGTEAPLVAASFEAEQLVVESNMPPEVVRRSRPVSPVELQSPVHDLALAGILPVLDTPGLAPLQDEEVFAVEDMDLSDLAAADVVTGGLVAPLDGSDTETQELPALDLLEIERTAPPEPLELEPRISQTDLLIVHGADPVVHPESEAAHRVQSREAAVQSSMPAAGLAMDLTSALSNESLKSIASTEAELQALIRVEPQDFTLHRRLGEVLVENGRRAEGLAELESAMVGFDDQGHVADALSVAEEILRLEPDSIRHHQKRVEYSFRNSDQALLVDSYLELADALFRGAQMKKAAAVYERVLELEPENSRATYALKALLASQREGAPDAGAPPEADLAGGAGAASDSAFVNLGELVTADEEPRSTRMVVDEEAPSGDEEADFAEMLEKFKRGLAENVDDEDYESHFDLGVAFREMGLLDEAIAQFQRALRGTRRRVRTLEALGQCFVERSQFQVAASVLERAIRESEGGDENLVGVLYLLGYSCEALQKYSEALSYYQRLFMVDIQFRDVSSRIAALEKMVK